MMRRRDLLGAGGAALIGGAGGLAALSNAASVDNDYRALVVLFLMGGNDGLNMLVPTDAAYSDYSAARANLALPRNSLVALPGSSGGHTLGVHPAMAPLAPLYGQGRLAFVANVGALVQPATAAQVLDSAVAIPPFLLSHSDQTAIAQGWTLEQDNSGWAGRGLELLPSSLKNALAANTFGPGRQLVLGRRSGVSAIVPGGLTYWGTADLRHPEQAQTQALLRMGQWQFANAYEADFARQLASSMDDQIRMGRAFAQAAPPVGDFPGDNLGTQLRSLASIMPVLKAQGLKRQVFYVQWGNLDTHAEQRGSSAYTQDTQLDTMAKALAAFDTANRASGLDANVTTLVMSEFGRTLRPGSGGGSEHAWGNHWLALGGAVAGGEVHGTLPRLTLGGPDDMDRDKGGRFVPTTSIDQVGAAAMQWLGLAPAQFDAVFPNLVNFQQKTIPLLRS